MSKHETKYETKVADVEKGKEFMFCSTIYLNYDI